MGMYEKILEGASRIFYKFGLSKISMDELAEQLGVSKKTIYNHFGGKEQLREEVLKYHNRSILEKVIKISEDKALSVMERLSTLQNTMMEEFGKLKEPAIQDIKRLAKDDIYWALDHHEQISKYFEKVMIEARELGFIKESVDVRLVIFSMKCIVRGMLSMKEGIPEGFVINVEMTDKIHNLFQEAMLTEKGLEELRAVRAGELGRILGK